MQIVLRLVVFAFVFSIAPSCKTPSPPAPVDVSVQPSDGGQVAVAPKPVDCINGVEQHAIADAQARAITVISQGINASLAESVIFKQLEGLAFDLAPGALSCALQYLGIKLDYDGAHAKGDVATQKMAEAKIARSFIRSHNITFSKPLPAPMNQAP